MIDDSTTDDSVDKILMLKNMPAYNISRDIVLNHDLLPGIMRKHASTDTYAAWSNSRYFNSSNASARSLFGSAFRQRKRADDWSFALGLSDCYWIKPDNSDVNFEDVSTYYQPFWSGNGGYSKYTAVPTVYTDGFLSKYWVDSQWLSKSGESVAKEIECSRLAKLCGIKAAEVTAGKKGDILVKNFTNSDIMFEQAIVSDSVFRSDNWDDDDIIREFGLSGFKMLLVDAVFANGDRHAGNFGYLRDANTGGYLGMAPLFDWNHALDTTGTNDILIRDAVRMVHKYEEWLAVAKKILSVISVNSKEQVYKDRASFVSFALQ
ncbi:MAG: hypothetical protein FWG42_10680 [Clostridiales bacterium]|nr:hypothetical protein [Clostridiales bacterium]